MTVTVFLRANQASPLTWSQVDDNFTALATQTNTNTAAIAGIVAATGGPTGSRPNPPTLFSSYFDTTLGYQIQCKQVSPPIWVNAAGASV